MNDSLTTDSGWREPDQDHARCRQSARVAALVDELRSPVQAIRSSLDVLAKAWTGGDDFQRQLDLIDRQVTHLWHLIDDLDPPGADPPDGGRREPPVRSRILVVDDNRDVAEALRDLLADRGRDVVAVTSGAAAVAACHELVPDVVLLDLGMPELDGYATARMLRALPGGDALTVIALTGRGSRHERGRTEAAGFDQHLVKPVTAAALEAALARAEATAGR